MNRRKKGITRLWTLSLLAAIFSSAPALGAEQSTQLTATVPSSHSVRLEIDEHGSVEVDGKTYTGTQTIQVERLKEQEYIIQAEDGYEITEVTYGPEGQAEEITLTGSAFTAPALNREGNVLTVTAEEETDGTEKEEETEKPEETEAAEEQEETEKPEETEAAEKQEETELPEETERTEESESDAPAGTAAGKKDDQNTNTQSVKTGDETPVLLPFFAMTAALAVMAVCGLSIRGNKKNL